MNERVYVAGPMTGLPDYNRQAFRDAAAQLRSEGYIVYSPIEMDDGQDCETWRWEDYLSRDIQFILQSDAQVVFALPGWDRSRGAQLELYAAHLRGLRLVAYDTREPVSLTLTAGVADPA